jgi:uroporphyrinogen-III synthase
MSFGGQRILSLESRRAAEMATLISRYDGIPVVAPSVKEKAVTEPDEALRFVADLEADAYDMVICMTGVGLGFMLELLTPSMPQERVAAALRRTTIVARGPKPVGILRSLDVAVQVMIPEPNTWREIVAAVTPRPERRIAIQEYGKANPDLTRALEGLQAIVTNVTFYRWELPEDLAPLRSAAHGLAKGEFAMVLFTSSIQLEHLLRIAEQEGIAEQVRLALKEKVRIASIGPVMTEALEAQGLTPHIVPKHPKMPSLVIAAAEGASA